MSEAILEVDSLGLWLAGRPILKDISLQVEAGQRWSILGPNGAGKSSLLRCLMRIHDRWQGEVRLFGRSLRCYSQRSLARRIAYVPQAGGEAAFPYTVREFVQMARYSHAGRWGSRSPGDREAVDSALERTSVAQLACRNLSTLSGGERQKVWIAAALAQESDVLLLDEPMAFLDYRHQSEVRTLLHSLGKASPQTILTVTHDVNAALEAGGQALALRGGRAVYSGPVAAMACQERLGEIFDTAFRFIEDPASGGCRVVPEGVTA